MTKAKPKLKKRPARRSPSYPLAQTNVSKDTTPPDLEFELQALRKQDKLSPTDDTKHAILSSCAAKPYTRQKDEVLNDFLCCLSLQPGSQWENLLKPRVVLLPNGETVSVPHLISSCSGFKTALKLSIANHALIAWNSTTKKKRIGPKCSFIWYQPVTQSQRVRALFGLLNKKYLWQMTLDDFEGERMLGPFLAGLYQSRFKKYGNVGYAQPKTNRRLTLNNRRKISLAMFDENNPEQHLMKVLFGCGAMFGFRGSAEHTYLELGHIRKGVFPAGHPWEGKTYYGFGGFQSKTKKYHSATPLSLMMMST